MASAAKPSILDRWADRFGRLTGRRDDVRRRPPRKILYVHVAKAGGSSFNLLLHRYFHGESHCEQYVEQRQKPGGGFVRELGNLENLRRLDFLSGHLTLPLLEHSGLDLHDYMRVTILRHPFMQTISHMNWVIKISEDEAAPLYQNVSSEVQQMSQALRAVDEWSPQTVMRWLELYPHWFQNNQARYFLTSDSLHEEGLVEKLSGLDLVGVTERLDAFVTRFARLTGLGRQVRATGVPHENRNPAYHVPLAVLEDTALRDFLTGYNRFDMALYAHAEKHLAP